MGRRGKRRKQPLDGLMKTLEFRRPRSHSVENSLWKIYGIDALKGRPTKGL